MNNEFFFYSEIKALCCPLVVGKVFEKPSLFDYFAKISARSLILISSFWTKPAGTSKT